ncbi:unnamed protein product [Paramecium primaurelia]|uniref:Uncharacterized protein n=1 Tax=Paramecium primaurelia TaxID=5886 RepID=A0A8S1QI32_PARPR|nr:unnamed protein product [Paramecium primaurelia]
MIKLTLLSFSQIKGANMRPKPLKMDYDKVLMMKYCKLCGLLTNEPSKCQIEM